jgi:hypothetical protein
MTTRQKIVVPALVVAAMVAAGTRVETARAQNAAAQTPSAAQDSKQKEKNLEVGVVEASRLVLLMDRDQNGKVSKREFMSFMEEEFQRLDINKDGELDVKELTQSRLVPHGGVHR